MLITTIQGFGALEIIFTFVKSGTAGSLWGLLVSGIILASVAVIGILAGLTRRSQLAGLFFWALLFGFLASAAVLIVNAATLNHNMNSRCSNSGFARDTTGCQNIREYRILLCTIYTYKFPSDYQRHYYLHCPWYLLLLVCTHTPHRLRLLLENHPSLPQGAIRGSPPRPLRKQIPRRKPCSLINYMSYL